MSRPIPPITSDWMKVREAAARLDCDDTTVINRIRSRDLPVRVLRFGSVRRINRADFEKNLDRMAVTGRNV